METYKIKNDVNELLKDENGKHTLRYLRTDEYFFTPAKHTILVVQRNGVKKNIRVEENPEFTYSVKKTKVNANGGAEGLAKFLADPEWKSTAVKLLDTMMDNVKPAKLLPWE